MGGYIDDFLFGTTSEQTGPRLDNLKVASSAEGKAIERLFGRNRVAGNMIWAANFREEKRTRKEGGKGGGSGTKVTTFEYYVSFAVAFIEGHERVQLGRVWADGQLMDLEKYQYTFYPGSDTQPPDSTMESIEGAGNVPAYTGISYLVFTDLPLGDFGRRIPSISAEIIKPLETPDADSMENLIEAVNLIPATGESAYGTTPTVRDDGFGNSVPENLNLSGETSNLVLSMESLGNQLPNSSAINLVISWFGDDLRVSDCTIKPKVELKSGRTTYPDNWSVQGLTRGSATIEQVTLSDGSPAYGGTPADWSVVEAVQYICDTKGDEISFYPFVLMDIPSGNSLPDPYSGGTGQSAYPWRGRITTSSTTIDKTSAAQTEVDNFFGAAAISDFSVSGTEVTYTGNASDFGYRRYILHYAHLCAAAANSLTNSAKFKSFYIGSEMRGLTRIRSTPASTATASTVYPGVNGLVELLQDVRAVFDNAGLTGVELSYAGDWSEYNAHSPGDGSGDVYFNMDALWAHPDCDYVAIDNYAKMSDWREGDAHLDYGNGTVDDHNLSGPFGTTGFPQATSIYDRNYLEGQVLGGEDYHYFYASESDRDAQIRTTIDDVAHGEHWVFRQKDFPNWWGETHRSRPGGTRDAVSTGLSDGSGGQQAVWTAQGKRIVFSEYGIPAVDKGTNQPNVFFDPKSSESNLPHFSKGTRDDTIQRAYYEAMIEFWAANSPAGMLVTSEMYAWTWDARPYPAFPFRPDIWSDADNYELGHWLNGRAGVFTLGQLVREICGLAGLDSTLVDVTGLSNSYSVVRGYSIDSLASPRDLISPLEEAYLMFAFESDGKLKFALKANTLFQDLTDADLVIDNDDSSGYSITRQQETELPAASTVSFIDERQSYQVGSVGGVRVVGNSRNVIETRLPLVLEETYARSLSEIMIQQAWTARERGEIRLPPSKLALDPGDGINLQLQSKTVLSHVIGSIDRGADLALQTARHDVTVFDNLSFKGTRQIVQDVAFFGRSVVFFMEIPLISANEPSPWAPRVAGYQSPYPESVDIYEVDGNGNTSIITEITEPSVLGITTDPLTEADPYTFDGSGVLRIKFYNPNGQVLSFSTKLDTLNSNEALAIETASGYWEIIQWKTATLVGSENGLPIYELTELLRGRLGTDVHIDGDIAAGAKVVVLDASTVVALGILNSLREVPLDYRFGPSGSDVNGTLYQDITYTGKATPLMPYSPVHLKRKPKTNGDIEFAWTRRTRYNGDNFEEETTPLNETFERYDIEILDATGSTMLRSVSNIESPSYLYTTTEQSADGGTLDQYTLRVFQKSEEVGRGFPGERVL